MKNTGKTIIRISLLTLAALLIGLNVYSINASRLAGDAVPMPFGVGAAVVLSGSMEPALSAGDLLIVTEEDSYGVGDVVVYQDGSSAVTHRIVSMEEIEVENPDSDSGESLTEWQFVTQGDANNIPDSPIHQSRIKGKVSFRIPYIGYVVNLIKTPIGTILILAAAVFLLERSFRRDKERDHDQLETLRREIEQLKKQNEKTEI